MALGHAGFADQPVCIAAIEQASGGRIKIEVFSAGAFVRAFETFEAVGAGIADMYHSFEGYFTSKSPALNFFSAIPFGFTAHELMAWVQYGGGQELWDALSGQFNIKPLLCTSTGCQMGGWFARAITSPKQYKGLRYRMAGPGAEVLRRLGATVVTLPGGEIMEALQSGAIDACEWIGPWLDMSIGLHKAVGYYYYPGFHEPGSGFSLGINKRVWEILVPCTGGRSRPMRLVSTRAPSPNSMPTTHCGCTSCARRVV